jgi:hypothetical protein
MDQLKEQLQSCGKGWQVRLRAETNNWQARLEEQQQDVEKEQTKMAEAFVIMCSCVWERDINQFAVYRMMCCYISLSK